MEKKLVKHRVVVDAYTSIELSIPEELTPDELRGLMLKAKKLFNLSEVELVAPKATSQGRGHGGRRLKLWTREADELLMKHWELPVREFLEKFKEQFGKSVSDASVYSRRKKLKKIWQKAR